MQSISLDNMLINEIQLGTGLNHAVESGRRADFSLMLALLSSELMESTPQDTDQAPIQSEQQLRAYFELPTPQPLTTSEHCYQRSAEQAKAFHEASIVSTRLLQGLQPTALTFPVENTKGLPEDIFHNLSVHERRKLPPEEPRPISASPQNLYASLIHSKRTSELYHAA
ncbi:VC2046/SO_2500 family protein [Photobacterium leiognathi subsp. mandapamensis]|uniref:VC2046/SO_2500 family protein n=1 Tax=Photobacterium leiognathi TaxID=553611 RepID=UPI003BF53FC3